MTKFSGGDAGRVCGVVCFTAAAGAAAFFVYRYLKKDSQSGNSGLVNLDFQKDSDKVVHSFDIEDLANKQAYCRCWRSKKFPMCDGSHNKHNESTGDNVGPLCIQKKAA